MASKRRKKLVHHPLRQHRMTTHPPYRAHAFDTLLSQIKEMYPNRSTTGGPDGWLGDAKHASRSSDHNPRDSGIVLAQDISHDPKHGFDSYKFCDMLISEGFRDKRLRYVISNGRIAGNEEFCKSNPQYHLKPWEYGKYTGENKHDKHCHLSLVHDEDLANDTSPWNINGKLPEQPDAPVAETRPTLRKGDEGEFVTQLQLKLGIEADGDFGSKTEDAVEDFQKSHGVKPVDGIVGPYTWEVLDKVYPVTPEPKPTPSDEDITPPGKTFSLTDLPGYDQKAINDVVEDSPVSRYNWPGRGNAPIGYIKGVASSFARAILFYRQRQEPWVSMGKPASGSSSDALNWYKNKFAAAGLTSQGSEDVIRHIFVLLLGLGMRESSGEYTEGKDPSADNTSGETTEGGMFQTSWNIRGQAPGVSKLFEIYKNANADILLDVYKEGSRHEFSRDYGNGPGRDFQHLSKHSPDFAAQVAAIGLRSARDHWGPINRREAVVLRAADDMLKQVQDTLNKGALTS